ncbi:hypothetical protein M0802_007407 [Mischocyttarus mexicanus]|nr:hypothetical protein M0802_007407 [Mischocyttarus mexicanus]
MSKGNKLSISTKKRTRSNQNKVKKRTKSNQNKVKKNKRSKLLKKSTTNRMVVEYKQTDSLTINNSSSGQSQSSSSIQPRNLSDQKKVDKNSIENKKPVVPVNVKNGRFLNSYESEFTLEQSQDDLFNLLHTQQITLTLPNRSWSIHFTDKPVRSFVLSEISLHSDSGSGFIPHYSKQVVFHERMAYEIFLFNSKTIDNDFSPIETVADVMHVIAYTNNLKLCSGGPEVSSCKNINLECAYKDKNRWRHNLCSLRVSVGDICPLCLTLKDKLKQSMQRIKQSKTRTSTVSGKRKKRS